MNNEQDIKQYFYPIKQRQQYPLEINFPINYSIFRVPASLKKFPKKKEIERKFPLPEIPLQMMLPEKPAKLPFQEQLLVHFDAKLNCPTSNQAVKQKKILKMFPMDKDHLYSEYINQDFAIKHQIQLNEQCQKRNIQQQAYFNVIPDPQIINQKISYTNPNSNLKIMQEIRYNKSMMLNDLSSNQKSYIELPPINKYSIQQTLQLQEEPQIKEEKKRKRNKTKHMTKKD